jgi:hypothetical protein
VCENAHVGRLIDKLRHCNDDRELHQALAPECTARDGVGAAISAWRCYARLLFGDFLLCVIIMQSTPAILVLVVVSHTQLPSQILLRTVSVSSCSLQPQLGAAVVEPLLHFTNFIMSHVLVHEASEHMIVPTCSLAQLSSTSHSPWRSPQPFSKHPYCTLNFCMDGTVVLHTLYNMPMTLHY